MARGTCVDRARASRSIVSWEPSDWHGRRQIAAYTIDGRAPLALLDPRHAANADWARRVVFFDLETTGLSGGAGTLAFLAGCGWFGDDGFHVRQFFLTGPAGEPAMLDGARDCSRRRRCSSRSMAARSMCR